MKKNKKSIFDAGVSKKDMAVVVREKTATDISILGNTQPAQDWVRLSRPPMIKPKQLSQGAAFSAKLLRVEASWDKKFKGKILVLESVETGKAFAFPATATVSSALGGDDQLETFIGQILGFSHEGFGISKQTGKEFPIIAVYKLEKTKK